MALKNSGAILPLDNQPDQWEYRTSIFDRNHKEMLQDPVKTQSCSHNWVINQAKFGQKRTWFRYIQIISRLPTAAASRSAMQHAAGRPPSRCRWWGDCDVVKLSNCLPVNLTMAEHEWSLFTRFGQMLYLNLHAFMKAFALQSTNFNTWSKWGRRKWIAGHKWWWVMSVGDDDKTVIQTQGLVTMHGPWYQGCLLHLSPHHPIPYQCRSGSFGWNGIAQFPNAYSCHRKPQKDRRTVSGCSDDVFVSSSCSFWVVLCYFVYLNMSIYIYMFYIPHFGGPSCWPPRHFERLFFAGRKSLCS